MVNKYTMRHVYPYNHVFESESGHVFEIDDTRNNERLFTQHRTGTSQEIDKDGNQVNIIKGGHYNIVSGKRQAVIEGNGDLTIGGGDIRYTLTRTAKQITITIYKLVLMRLLTYR